MSRAKVQAIPAQANLREAQAKAQSAGRRHNRLHTQKALLEFLLLGRVNP